MPVPLNPEWRDENLMRKYPFSDVAIMQTSDNLSIPVDLFVDAKFWHFQMQAPFWLDSIEIDTGVVTMVVRDSSGFTLTGKATPTNTGRIAFYDSEGIPGGVLILTEPASINYLLGWPIGTHVCSKGKMEFAVRTWSPSSGTGLRGFTLPDGTRMYGPTIKIVAGLGVWFAKGVNGLEIHIPGDPLANNVVAAKCQIDPVQAKSGWYFFLGSGKLKGEHFKYYPYAFSDPKLVKPGTTFGTVVQTMPWKKVNGHDGLKHLMLMFIPNEQVVVKSNPTQHQIELSMVGSNG